jgi:hypothetical protein
LTEASAQAWGESSVPRRSQAVVEQRASESLVLVHIDSGRYYALEGTGDRFWHLCDGQRTVADIVSELSTQYGKDPAAVRADASELLKELAAEGLIDDAS